MAGIEDRVKGFIETWEKRKSGEIPSPDLTVSCSACGGLIMGAEEIEPVDMEVVCRECRGGVFRNAL